MAKCALQFLARGDGQKTLRSSAITCPEKRLITRSKGRPGAPEPTSPLIVKLYALPKHSLQRSLSDEINMIFPLS